MVCDHVLCPCLANSKNFQTEPEILQVFEKTDVNGRTKVWNEWERILTHKFKITFSPILIEQW